jgi:hypothetical protein
MSNSAAMRYALSGLFLLGVTACGGNTAQDENDGAGGSTGGKSGAGGSAAGGGKAGASGSGTGGTSTGGKGGSGGGTGGTGTSGAGGAIPDEVTIEMGPFEVQPGADTYRCQNFANPFGGADVDIAEFETHMTEGSHHLIVNYSDAPATSAPEPCSGFEAPTGPFSTQVRDDLLTYPEGVGAALDGIQGLRINSHYFNTTGDAFEATVSVTMRRAKPGTVRARAYSTISIVFGIDVPAYSAGSASGALSFGEDVSILGIGPHMHFHGTRFVVTSGGEHVFETDDWETAPHRFDPARVFSATDQFDFTCEYLNDTSTPLTFGESAANNEMCILGAQYYRTADLR